LLLLRLFRLAVAQMATLGTHMATLFHSWSRKLVHMPDWVDRKRVVESLKSALTVGFGWLGITKTEDCHSVYERYAWLFERHFKSPCIFVARRGSHLRFSSWFVGAVYCLITDIDAVLRACWSQTNQLAIIREFSAFSLPLLLPLILIYRHKLVFNINHNLNSRAQGWIINTLSGVCRFCFIGAGQKLKSQFPKIEVIPFEPTSEELAAATERLKWEAVAFVGSRPEQLVEDLEAKLGVLQQAAAQASLPLHVIGKNGFGRSTLATTGFVDSLQEAAQGRLVVFLYNPDAYRLRHSGVLWDLVTSAGSMLLPKTDTIESTASARSDVCAWFDGDNLGAMVEAFKAIAALHMLRCEASNSLRENHPT
jgi:hypothetical protein